MNAAAAPPARPRLCPICRQHPADPRYRPFCSRRCADIDLGRWFDERYRIPSTSFDENGDDEDAPEAGPGDIDSDD